MSRILQMEAFKSLCERKSYTAAANELGISQSYLSKLIKKLEENYGVELVAKKNNEIILTVAGEELYDSCCFILSEFKRLDQKLRRMGNSKGKSIVVGITRNAAMADFYTLTNQFIIEHPNIDVTTVEVHPEKFKDYLDMEKIDIAVGWIKNRTSRHYEFFPIVSGTWKLCVNNKHPFALREEVYWKDLKDCELILSSDDNHRARMILEFQKKGFYPKIKHYAVFFYNVLELVNMNQGVAPIPSTLDISNYENVKTISLLPEEPCTFSVATRKGEQPESVKDFIEFCTSLKNKR